MTGVQTCAPISAAEKGYGPLLYDIAMAGEQGLMPDRDGVSPDATRVWQKYRDRPDVTSKLLDDINNPKTPPKIDDTSRLYPDDEENPLNYAYFIKSMPNTAQLRGNDVAARKFLAQLLGSDPNEVASNISASGEDYFHERYGN